MEEKKQKFKVCYYFYFNPDEVIESPVLYGCYQLLGAMNCLKDHAHIISILTL